MNAHISGIFLCCKKRYGHFKALNFPLEYNLLLFPGLHKKGGNILQNEHNIQNEDDLRMEDNPKNEDDLKLKISSKMKTRLKIETTSK